MKIAFYCSSGSPIGIIPPDVYGRGLGGAELSLVSLAETLASRGHQVVVYNNPRKIGHWNGVSYCPLGWFASVMPRADVLDAFILFRTPWLPVQELTCPKLFFSCDQMTAGNYATDIFPLVDHTVCISPYHRNYHIDRYGVDPDRISWFDLGVRLQDYPEEVEKVPGRCIVCSVPARGHDILAKAWPLIKEQVSHASLVITGDYRLWGVPYAGDERERRLFADMEDVQYLGRIPRRELCVQQLKAQVMAYPGAYEEMFCISAAECQVAGAIPVTSSEGALPTTVDYGVNIPNEPHSPEFLSEFVDGVVDVLNHPPSQARAMAREARASRRFDWRRIAGQWEKLIESFSGERT